MGLSTTARKRNRGAVSQVPRFGGISPMSGIASLWRAWMPARVRGPLLGNSVSLGGRSERLGLVSLVRGERPKVYVWGGVGFVPSSRFFLGGGVYFPSLVSMGKLVRGACGKVSANFDLYSVLLTFPWALLLSFLFFLCKGRVRNGTGTRNISNRNMKSTLS